MTPLLAEDTIRVAAALPEHAARALMGEPGKAFVAGGHARCVIAREERSDVDLFACDVDTAGRLINAISRANDSDPFETEFASTFSGSPPVQVIRAWTFGDPAALLEHFDFTTAQACAWWNGSAWEGLCSPHFYPDLAARRLRLADATRTRPLIEEGGTLLRLIRYSRKGYVVSPETVAQVAMAAVTAAGGDLDALTDSLRGIDPERWPEWAVAALERKAGEAKP